MRVWLLTSCCGIVCIAAFGCSTGFAAEPAPQWIVITAPGLQKAIEPLRRERERQGFQVSVVTTTDLLAKEEIERGDARKLGEAVHQVCRQGHGQAYILLVGATAVGPGKDAQATVVPPLTGTIGRMKDRPTDNAFGCLGSDRLPSIAVGRLPARTAAEAQQMVEKILAFEREGQQASWRRSITLLVGNPGGRSPAERGLANWYVSNTCRSTAEKLHPSWNLRAIYHIPESPWYVPDDKLHDKALEYLRQGQAFTCYLGHSGDFGFWSTGTRFIDRTDWASVKVPHGAGVFITCGCYSCQLDSEGREDHEGYGLAAIRNPDGPVAVAGAVGESYAAAGQLAFNGMLGDFSAAKLPDRLGELWLDLKAGIAKGPLDLLTFTIFDYGDGSQGKIPLDIQRQEHTEMWILLGDPAMRLPAVANEITLDVPKTSAPGATIVVRGTVAASAGAASRADHRRTASQRIAPGSRTGARGAGECS